MDKKILSYVLAEEENYIYIYHMPFDLYMSIRSRECIPMEGGVTLSYKRTNIMIKERPTLRTNH